MKKLIIVLIVSSYNIYCQPTAASIKLGAFNPDAASIGFIIGYEGGKSIDRNFDFGWSFDWFHKNYVDKELVQSFNEIIGVNEELNELRAKTNLHDFPLMVNVTMKFPIAPFFKFYATGGVGAELLLVDYRNYSNPDKSELKAAFDFNWRVGIGTAYNIGRFSEFLVEIDYHNSKPSWTYEVDDPQVGKKTFERVYDMRGFMIRAGFRFYY